MTHKLLGVPLTVWGLQLIYVAIGLVIFAVLLRILDKKTSQLAFQIIYVVAMVIINVIWRVALRKLKPEWWS
jgi:hypothetical protein